MSSPHDQAPEAVGPLTGVHVVSLAGQYPGPFATMLLHDLGAQVTMVEKPGGDPTRGIPRLFNALNRGKQGRVIDLKSAAGRSELAGLLEHADVLLDGFRPGVLDRLGFGSDHLRSRFPDLVVVAVTSYGATGPDSGLGAHDLAVQSRAGLLDGLSDPLGAVPTADLVSGMFAALAALTGLVARHGSTHAPHLDVSMLDSLVTWQAVRLAGRMNQEDVGYPPLEPAYGVFSCRGGTSITLAVAGEDHQWTALCSALGITDVATYDAMARAADCDRLRTRVAEACGGLDAGELLRMLDAVGVSCAPVRSLDEVLHDPQLLARGVFIQTPDGPAVRQPILVDGRAVDRAGAAPGLVAPGDR